LCPRPDSSNWPAVEERLFYPLGSWREDGGRSPEPVCVRGRIAFRPASIADNSASLIALNLRPSGYEVATDTSKLFAQADHEAVRQYPEDEWIVPRVCKIAGRHS